MYNCMKYECDLRTNNYAYNEPCGDDLMLAIYDVKYDRECFFWVLDA